MELPVVGTSIIEFRIPTTSLYPHEVPVIFFKNSTLPPKHRRKIVEKMVEECENLLGSAMIYSLTLWLTTNIAAIDANEELKSPFIESKTKPKLELSTSIQTKSQDKNSKLEAKPFEPVKQEPSRKMIRMPSLAPKERDELSKVMYGDALTRQKTSGYMKLKQVRERLPVFSTRERFLDLMSKNQVVVLTGETGSGKTTQVLYIFRMN